MKDNLLSTFQLVNQDRVISPILTTTREYGNWFEGTFDNYTAQMELYLRSKKKSGETVVEWHPGTRIGHWFDTNAVSSDQLKSWFILQDSPMMDRLVRLDMAEPRDAVPISVNDKEGRRMIRVYTTEQIQLYLRAVLDKNFDISKYVGIPKQVKVRDCDMSKLIRPQTITGRRKLF